MDGHNLITDTVGNIRSRRSSGIGTKDNSTIKRYGHDCGLQHKNENHLGETFVTDDFTSQNLPLTTFLPPSNHTDSNPLQQSSFNKAKEAVIAHDQLELNCKFAEAKQAKKICRLLENSTYNSQQYVLGTTHIVSSLINPKLVMTYVLLCNIILSKAQRHTNTTNCAQSRYAWNHFQIRRGNTTYKPTLHYRFTVRLQPPVVPAAHGLVVDEDIVVVATLEGLCSNRTNRCKLIL